MEGSASDSAEGSRVRDDGKRAWLCWHVPTPPKGRLATVMCMKPSFPQKPPLLVWASTRLTTWERSSYEAGGGAAGAAGALSRPLRALGATAGSEATVRAGGGGCGAACHPSPTGDVFPEHPLLVAHAGDCGHRLRPDGEVGNPASSWGRGGCRVRGGQSGRRSQEGCEVPAESQGGAEMSRRAPQAE